MTHPSQQKPPVFWVFDRLDAAMAFLGLAAGSCRARPGRLYRPDRAELSQAFSLHGGAPWIATPGCVISDLVGHSIRPLLILLIL